MTGLRRRGAIVSCAVVALFAGLAARADEPPKAVRFGAGASVFAANCAVCHRANGAGQSGLAPPLTDYPGRYVASAAGRRQLAATVLFGMFGDIVVGEKHFNFKMPEFSRLDDATLAEVLNFVAFDLAGAGSGASPLVAADIAAVRGAALGGDDVRRQRAEVVATFTP
jgi:mono/diheme cytochrome c family protein